MFLQNNLGRLIFECNRRSSYLVLIYSHLQKSEPIYESIFRHPNGVAHSLVSVGLIDTRVSVISVYYINRFVYKNLKFWMNTMPGFVVSKPGHLKQSYTQTTLSSLLRRRANARNVSCTPNLPGEKQTHINLCWSKPLSRITYKCLCWSGRVVCSIVEYFSRFNLHQKRLSNKMQ